MLQFGFSIFQALFGLAAPLHVPRTYFVLKKNQFETFHASLVFLMLFLFGIGIVLVYIAYFFFGDFLGIGVSWLLASPLVSFLMMVNLLNLARYRTQENPFSYARLELSHTFLNLTLSVFLLIHTDLGWHARALGIAIPMSTMGLVGLFQMKRSNLLSKIWDKKSILDILGVSLPLLPHTVGSIMISSSNRLFVEKYAGFSEVGVFFVGFQLGMVVMLITDSIIKAWTPWFFKKMATRIEADRRKIIINTYVYILLLFIFVLLYPFLLQFFMPFVVGTKYIAAIKYIRPVSFAFFFFGIYQIFFPYLLYKKKTWILGYTTSVVAIVNISLNWILIPRIGAIGAAYSLIVSYFITFVSVTIFSIKLQKMPWFESKK